VEKDQDNEEQKDEEKDEEKIKAAGLFFLLHRHCVFHDTIKPRKK